jgi:hypothetical protein
MQPFNPGARQIAQCGKLAVLVSPPFSERPMWLAGRGGLAIQPATIDHDPHSPRERRSAKLFYRFR